MLRPYFLFHRELLGELSRIAYHTVREMMATGVDEPDARPGMVAVIQTFGSSLMCPRLLAYVSDESGQHEVYVVEFPSLPAAS